LGRSAQPSTGFAPHWLTGKRYGYELQLDILGKKVDFLAGMRQDIHAVAVALIHRVVDGVYAVELRRNTPHQHLITVLKLAAPLRQQVL